MDESNDRASVGSSSAGGVRRARPRGGAARHIAARHGARLRPCASTARGHQLGNKPDRRGNRPTEPRPPRQSNSAGRWAHACKLEQRPFVRSRPSCSRSIEQVPAKLRARHGRATRPRPRAGARSRGGGAAHALLQPRGRRRRGAGRVLDVQEDLQGWQRAGGAARLGHGLHAHAAQGPEEGARGRAPHPQPCCVRMFAACPFAYPFAPHGGGRGQRGRRGRHGDLGGGRDCAWGGAARRGLGRTRGSGVRRAPLPVRGRRAHLSPHALRATARLGPRRASLPHS